MEITHSSTEVFVERPGVIQMTRAVEEGCGLCPECEAEGETFIYFTGSISDMGDGSVFSLTMPLDGWASLAAMAMRILAKKDGEALAAAIDLAEHTVAVGDDG